MKALIALLFGLTAVGTCQTWIVDPHGGGDFTSIQEAIYDSWNGDTILVRPGVYAEDIVFAGREVTLTSENPDDPNVVAATVLQGTITFYLNETLNSILRGFTIRGRVFPVSVGDYEQTAPKIQGSVVVWQDKRNYSQSGYDIYGMDLSTGHEFAVCTAAGDQISPEIYGDRVVWQDYRNSTTSADIYGLTLSTMQEFIVSNGTQDEAAPAIYGDTVVWQDSRAGAANYDIYGKNLATNTEFAVNTNSNNQMNPAIFDVVVVWQDYRSGSRNDIYAKNLQTGSTYVVSNYASNKINPAISSTYIVWEDYRNGNADIYSKNRSTNVEAAVVSTSAFQVTPAIYGDVVVWEDNSSGNYDIYSKNLTSGTQTVICSAAGNQTLPAISGSDIVWSDARWGTPLVVYMDNSRTETYSILCSYADATIQKNVFNTIENGIVGQYSAAPDILANTLLLANVGVNGCWGRIEENLFQLNGIGVYTCGGLIHNNVMTLNDTAISGCNATISSNTISLNATGIKSCSGIITDNTISQNTSYGISQSKGTISDNRIMENAAAGIASGGDAATEITGNYLISNAAGITGITAASISQNVISLNKGDGIKDCIATDIRNNIVSQNTGYGITNCTAIIRNNTVVQNSSSGIKTAQSAQTIKNNILVSNGGYGIEGGTISYNCFWRNTGGIYSGSVPRAGNTAVNPLFADMTNGDYHLKSQIGRWDPNTELWVFDTQTSRCIDAGDPADSPGQETNPNGNRIDMGAFGGTDQASRSPNGDGQIVPVCTTKPTMDFNGDCKVNLADFVLFTEQWLSCGLTPQESCS
jgi:beta propeller repeat protein